MALIFFFICLLFAFASIVVYSLLLGISPMPSSRKAQAAMLHLLPQPLDGGVIYELGSGWGGLALLLAKRFPQAKIVAIELSPIPFLFSQMRKVISRQTNLTFLRKNFYDHSLGDAGAIVCYLFGGGMRKLSLLLEKELPDRCPIVSNSFSLPGWPDESQFFVNDWAATRIYTYEPIRNVEKKSGGSFGCFSRISP